MYTPEDKETTFYQIPAGTAVPIHFLIFLSVVINSMSQFKAADVLPSIQRPRLLEGRFFEILNFSQLL
jgi:hypothetical protein